MVEDDPRLVAIYDDLNSGTWDTDFYLSKLGQTPLRIADVGCGTGAFAVRLSRSGHEVVGVDPSPQMLDYAKNRDGHESVEWVFGTAVDLPLGPFDVALMTGHAFQNLRSDQAVLETLTAVRKRLSPNGRFMFESRNPAAQAWLGWNNAEGSPVVTETAHAGRIEEHYQVYDVAGDQVDFGCLTTFVSDGAQFQERMTLRFIDPSRLGKLLNEAGFGRVDWYGAWDGTAFDAATSREIIIIAHQE